MDLLLKKLANLLSVKSLVTFCVLTIQNAIPENFMNVYTMVVTFYFVKQLNTETDNGAGK